MDSPLSPLRDQGFQALQEGNLEKAIDFLARAVMADDKDSDAKALLGITYSQKGLHAQARRALETAVSSDPQNANYRFNLGIVLERGGDLPAAAVAFRDTLQINPQHPQAKAKLQALGPQAHQPAANAPKLNVPPVSEAPPAQATPPPPQPMAPPVGSVSAGPAPGMSLPPTESPPPGTVQCEYCHQFSKPGMVCEHCAQPLPPPAKVVAPPPVMSAPTGGYQHNPVGATVPGYAKKQWGFDSGMSTAEAALRRWAARVVDQIILVVAAVGVLLVTGQFSQVTRNPGQTDEISNVAIVIVLMIWAIYSVTLTALTGQTLGKMLLGIRVVGPDDTVPGFGRALLREVVGRGIEEFFCALGVIWMLWDAEQQTWHDKIGGTHVVRV